MDSRFLRPIAGRISRPIAALVVASVFAGPAIAQPPPDLQRIRALYEGASYEDAMRALEAAEDTPIMRGEQHQLLLQYRALCQLALDRQSDAEKTVEQILSANPLHQPAPEVPPRLLTVFERVRARIVPALIQEQYAAAKTLFDNRQFVEAASGFERVVQLGSSVARSERDGIGDLSTLASGFLELSRARAAEASPDRTGAANHVFTSLDQDVAPPVPIRQDMPPWRPPPRRALAAGSANVRQGSLDLLIGPTGDVQDAVITTSVDPRYDAALAQAAKGWKYRPAMKNGVAVNYRRTVIIRLVSSD